MAEPSEGAYAIINVSTKRALDVYKKSGSYTQWLMTATRSESKTTQMWALDQQGTNNWQIASVITWRCADASDSTYGKHVSDNNKTSQRWVIATDGNTVTYNNTSYPSYTIRSKASGNKYLADRSDEWVGLISSVTDMARWILVPGTVLNSVTNYKLISESDVNKYVVIANGSKANSANALINKSSQANDNLFKTIYDQQHSAIQFVNVRSGKALDIWQKAKSSGVPDNVAQWTLDTSGNSSSWSQKWLVMKTAYKKTINGISYPTYTLRSLKYTNYALSVGSGGNLCMASYNAASASQRFIFMASEIYGDKLTVPGAITNTVFSRNDPGSVDVKGLTFSSSYTMFQARYKLVKYKLTETGLSVASRTGWMNLKDNSTTNDGWPAENTISFTASVSNGVATIPSSIVKTITLDSPTKSGENTCVWVDMYIQIRPFVTDYQGSGRIAHGASKETIVKIRQKPTVSFKSLSMRVTKGSKDGADSVAVNVAISDSFGIGCTLFKARLIGEDGVAISPWHQASNTQELDFVLGSTLYRLPNQNENIKISYYTVFKDNLNTSGSFNKPFSYTTGSSITVSHSVSINGSYAAIIKAPRHEADACFMHVNSPIGMKMVQCRFWKVEDNYIYWQCLPPINKDVSIVVYARNSDITQVLRGETTIRFQSHTFIWNWGNTPKGLYSDFASLIVNSGAPPQQKRTYTMDTNFHKPAGRILPVAFSDRSVDLDLSVTGIAVDENAHYVAAGPIPPHTSVDDVLKLVSLAGKGIHPIYRTPYGDWYQVGITSVDVSKNNLDYSDITVNQKALED